MNILERLYIAVFKEKAKRKLFSRGLARVSPPNLEPVLRKDAVHFKHFGLIGDIIYAIPAMKVLAGDRKIHLHLQINQKTLYKKSMKHPNEGKILTEKSVSMLAPLLLSQPEFAVCDILTDQPVDYDLDEFRNYPFDYNTNHICRWYFHMYGITADLGQPWLRVNPDHSFKDEIVIARSFRYRAPGISYDFLRNYPDITFVGLKEEYEDMKKAIPGLKYRVVTDFLEFAQIIAGCKFFIGNQSFPFAVAEGLKVKRVLELCFECPNVIPEGKDAYDFCYQPQFEKIVRELYYQ
ncbi:MAG: hypothetical protein HZA79_08365 [Sphingobacteriales bacterium]|nr:hypothetical protein [Sphingobacteriales bacterium]